MFGRKKINVVKFLNEKSKRKIIQEYSKKLMPELSYATANDFYDSLNNLSRICYMNGDLKNVQRSWMVKAIIGMFPIGAKLLEIGGGIPYVAGFLTELGFDVTIVDPYDRVGSTTEEYKIYKKQFPNVKIIKKLFGNDLSELEPSSFECIFSVSVLEHIPLDEMPIIFAGIEKFLKSGGRSIHCIDFVCAGNDADYHKNLLRKILEFQINLRGFSSKQDSNIEPFLNSMESDVDTYYLSAEGHYQWMQGLGMTKETFPFRRVTSVNSNVIYSE